MRSRRFHNSLIPLLGILCILHQPVLAGDTETGKPVASYVIEPDQILALNQQMKSLADVFVKPVIDKEQRARSLLDLIFNENKMGLKYDLFSTKSAVAAVESGTGNCLSLANVYIAMGRYVGLDARFLSVDVPYNWLEINEYYYLTKHTTAAIKLSNTKTATIEFFDMSRRDKENTEFVSDERGFAQFYNNIGIEYLEQDNLEAAVQNLRQSITMDKTYAVAWNNLGVVYRRLNRMQDAEQAYQTALNIDRKNLSALSNLATLYKAMGNPKFADKYAGRLERYRRKNPYYLIRLAERAIEAQDYKQAIVLSKQAIQKQRDEHRFYFVLAQAYTYLQQSEKAARSLELALLYADSEEPKSVYQHKLNLLREHAI